MVAAERASDVGAVGGHLLTERPWCRGRQRPRTGLSPLPRPTLSRARLGYEEMTPMCDGRGSVVGGSLSEKFESGTDRR